MRSWMMMVGFFVSVAGCAVPPGDVCDMAAEHLSECTGSSVTAPECTPEAAAQSERALATSCEDLVADKGDGDGFWCWLFGVGCGSDGPSAEEVLVTCQASCNRLYENQCPDGHDPAIGCGIEVVTSCHTCCAATQANGGDVSSCGLNARLDD